MNHACIAAGFDSYRVSIIYKARAVELYLIYKASRSKWNPVIGVILWSVPACMLMCVNCVMFTIMLLLANLANKSDTCREDANLYITYTKNASKYSNNQFCYVNILPICMVRFSQEIKVYVNEEKSLSDLQRTYQKNKKQNKKK